MKDANGKPWCACTLVPITRENHRDFTGSPPRLRGMTRHAEDHCCSGYCRICDTHSNETTSEA